MEHYTQETPQKHFKKQWVLERKKKQSHKNEKRKETLADNLVVLGSQLAHLLAHSPDLKVSDLLQLGLELGTVVGL